MKYPKLRKNRRRLNDDQVQHKNLSGGYYYKIAWFFKESNEKTFSILF